MHKKYTENTTIQFMAVVSKIVRNYLTQEKFAEFSDLLKKELLEASSYVVPLRPVLSSASEKRVFTINACTNEKSIAIASDIFDVIDSDFSRCAIEAHTFQTKATDVCLYEFTNEVRLSDLFSILCIDRMKSSLTQHQIVEFVMSYRFVFQETQGITMFPFLSGETVSVAWIFDGPFGLQVEMGCFDSVFVSKDMQGHRIVFKEPIPFIEYSL